MPPIGKIVTSTNAQLKLLVDYMSTNPLFAAGQFTGPLGAQKIEEEWVQLQQLLAEAGPAKTVAQWKHTWRDLKKRARDEAGRARIAHSRTGNVVPIPKLSETSLKILGTIGPECAVGIGVESETTIGEIGNPGEVVIEMMQEEVPTVAEDQLPASASQPNTRRGAAPWSRRRCALLRRG